MKRILISGILFASIFFVFMYTKNGKTGNRFVESNVSAESQGLKRSCYLEKDTGCKNRIVLTFFNFTNQDWYILKDNIVSDDRMATMWHVFHLTRDGINELPYSGIMLKRPAPPQPTQKDFVRLKSGQTKKTKICLDQHYDISRPGEYRMKYFAVNPSVGENPDELEIVQSNEISFSISSDKR